MLILASASPRRRRLLAAAGVPFTIDAADIDETLPSGVPPGVAAESLAEAKATAVLRRHPGAWVLGADTIVVAEDGTVLGKPVDAADARRMLRCLSASTQTVVTGVCLIGPAGTTRFHDKTQVTMREISADEIEAYVASGEPFGKAGGYAIQERGDRFVVKTVGSWSNVVGLPIERVTALLADVGVLAEDVA